MANKQDFDINNILESIGKIEQCEENLANNIIARSHSIEQNKPSIFAILLLGYKNLFIQPLYISALASISAFIFGIMLGLNYSLITNNDLTTSNNQTIASMSYSFDNSSEQEFDFLNDEVWDI